jgi:hypothetical protein
MRISTNKVSSVMLRPKKFEIRKNWENVKEPKKQSAMKLSQIRQIFETNPLILGEIMNI